MESTIKLRARAAQGDADAQFRIGYRRAFHRDPKQRDWPSAVRYWKAAAVQGHTRANST